MSLCPRGCGRPSRRVLTQATRGPALCVQCRMGTGRPGVYLTADRAWATRKGNATKRRREAAAIEAAYQQARIQQRAARKVAA